MTKPTITAKPYPVLRDAIERGIGYGYRRAFKHDDRPTDDHITETILQAVLSEVLEAVNLGDEDEDGHERRKRGDLMREADHVLAATKAADYAQALVTELRDYVARLKCGETSALMFEDMRTDYAMCFCEAGVLLDPGVKLDDARLLQGVR